MVTVDFNLKFTKVRYCKGIKEAIIHEKLYNQLKMNKLTNTKRHIIWTGLSWLTQQEIEEDVVSFAGEKIEDKMEDLLSR